MKKTRFTLMAGALLLGANLGSYAADDQIVIDDLTPAELRAEIKKIQTEFYRVWNQLNQDDSLDITCQDYTPTGSNIGREACEPNFMIERRARNAADSNQGTDELLDSTALRADLTDKFEELTKAMNAVAANNQYFKDLNTILGVLRARLDEIN